MSQSKTLSAMAAARGLIDIDHVETCTQTKPAAIETFVNEHPGVEIVVLPGNTALSPELFALSRRLGVEFFTRGELQFDIATHEDVPPHTLLPEPPPGAENLPWMLESDPMARYFAARPGQVFAITRPTEITPGATYTAYLRVVPHSAR